MENTKQVVENLMGKVEQQGFSGKQLRADIEEGVTMGLPVFHADYAAMYGQEHMTYRLTFTQTSNEELPYIFTELQATHRDPVDIEHHLINGTDTRVLDNLMGQVDWNKTFSGEPASGQNSVAVNHLFSELRKLGEGNPSYGKFIQQCLMYKYWPENIYQKYRDPEQPDLKAVHEHSCTFKVRKGDQLNAHMAFHIISERYDSLRDMVDQVGLHELGGTFLTYDLLVINLCKNADTFSLDGSFNLPEGYVSFSVPVTKIDGWYSIQEYELSLTPYPIRHDVFNGIDTYQLEMEMMKINWKSGTELFIFHDDRERDFQPAVNDIQEQLYRVSQDLVGADVADLLALKYLQGITFFDSTILQTAWDLLDELPKITRKFPAEQEITSAAYMLAGRAVFSATEPEMPENTRHWTCLDLSDAEGGYPDISIEGFSRQELEEMLRPVCPFLTDRSRIAAELMSGKRAHMESSADKRVLVEANPERKDLLFYSEDLRPIPVNLKMDPDWLPPGSKEDTAGEQQTAHRHFQEKQHVKNPRGKNKGLRL